MLHSYPREYYELYDSFKDGSGTIRKWVNFVEQATRRIVDSDFDYNVAKLKKKLSVDWTLNSINDNYFQIIGPKKSDNSIIREIDGSSLIYDEKGEDQKWIFTFDGLVRYINREEINKFKGDMLEILSEIFFNIFQADEAVGIKEYTPIEIGLDFGIDAVGINVNGHRVAIQVKYRSNPAQVITYSEIARTFTQAVVKMQMMDVVEHDHTIYLFTTAGGTTAAFDQVMGKKAVVIPRQVIARRIDNNHNFWDVAFREVRETLAM